jgi:predicted PurR-regulated permease PerM
VNRLPVLTEKLREALRDGRGTMQPVQQAADDINEAAGQTSPRPPRGVTRVQVEEPTTRVSDLIWLGTMGAIQFVVQATIVLFLVYYLLATGDRYKAKILTLAGPSMSRRHVTTEILHRITEQIERFLIARVIITLIVSVASVASFLALGLNQAIIWGILTGLLNNIPYAGPSVAVVAVSLAAMVQFGTLEMVLAAGTVTMIISVIEGFVLTPWMMGRAGRMNTAAVFVSLMFWGWIWGSWGLLLAVPIMMTIKAVCDHIEAFTPVSELLSE